MNTEIKENKVMRDPKVYKAILGIKVEIKEWAKSQREIRLSKQQKDPYDKAKITALHRVYLEIRGKDPEAHHLPERTSYLYEVAQKYTQKIFDEYELESVKMDQPLL